LLRTHVRHGPHDHAGLRCGENLRGRIVAIARLWPYHLGESEVQNLDAAVASDQDIGGFQIPMNDTGRMRRRESVRDLHRQIQKLVHRFHRRRQWLALDQFADDVVLADVVDRDDVGMVQSRDGPGFRVESGAIALRRQQLERHAAVQSRIVGLINLSHSARAEQLDNPVRAYLRIRG